MARGARLQVKNAQHFLIDERMTAPQDRGVQTLVCRQWGAEPVSPRFLKVGVMGFFGGAPAVRLLKKLSPTGQSKACPDGRSAAYLNKCKLEALFGGSRVG
jgi:hypothetical protein